MALPPLRHRLLAHETEALMESVLLGTWTRPIPAVIVATITSNMGEPCFRPDGRGLTSEALASIIIRWAKRSEHLPLNFAESVLLSDREKKAAPMWTMMGKDAFIGRMVGGCVNRTKALLKRGKPMEVPTEEHMQAAICSLSGRERSLRYTIIS